MVLDLVIDPVPLVLLVVVDRLLVPVDLVELLDLLIDYLVVFMHS